MMDKHYEDDKPFHRMMKDVADKIEEKRQAFNERRGRSHMGTLKGFEEMILKRKQEAHNAKRDSY